MRSAARTACTPSRRPSGSSSPAGRSSSTAIATRLARALEGMRVGKLSGAVGTYAAADPEVERIACERLGLEPAPSSTQVVQRDRHAELLSRARAPRVVARPLRARDPAPRAHRGARGRGAVRQRPEGLVGDAAQAQPDRRRADLRARARRARRRARRARERRALARARHLALVGRARRASRLPSSPSTTCSTASPGSSRGSSSDPERMRANLEATRRALLQPAAAARARRVRARARRGVPARAAPRDARLGRGRSTSATLVDADPEIAAPRRPRRASSTSARYTRHVDVVFERLRALVATDEEEPMPEAVHVASGKVREIYALDDERLLLVASDRISTFDVVLPTPIPDKGRVLTGLVGVLVRADARDRPEPPARAPRPTAGRWSAGGSRCCPIECVVRGYLAGSGWKDYQETGAVCGHALPAGLARVATGCRSRSSRRRRRRSEGHDENIDEEQAADALRRGALPPRRSEASLALYRVRRARTPRRAGSSSPTRSSSSASIADGVARARRRGAHARLVALLAGRRVRARAAAAVVRQAVRPRLLRARRAGTRPPPGPSCPTTSSPGRARATSRRSSG